jgi:hypothetical protein
MRAEWLVIPLVFLNLAILAAELFYNLLSGVLALF